MTASIQMTAPRAWARTAGVLWLITVVLGVFAEGFVRNRVITSDAATTIANILANENTYRLGLAALLVGTSAYLALTPIMYFLLAPISRTASLIAACFSIVGCTIWISAVVNDAAPLVYFAREPFASDLQNTQLLAFGLLKLHSEALLLGMSCFGVHCLLMGGLIVRSTFLPRLLGLILGVGGLGYMAAALLHVLAPAMVAPLSRYLLLPGGAGEALLGLWLTIVGLNAERWKTLA